MKNSLKLKAISSFGSDEKQREEKKFIKIKKNASTTKRFGGGDGKKLIMGHKSHHSSHLGAHDNVIRR